MSNKKRYKAIINGSEYFTHASSPKQATVFLRRQAIKKCGVSKCTDFLMEDDITPNKYNRISFGFPSQ
jgi:hypothetical protein